MKNIRLLLLCLIAFAFAPACTSMTDVSDNTPEHGQAEQGLAVLFICGGAVNDSGFCPPGTYKPSIKKLDGVVVGGPYVFPLKNFQLTLKDGSGNILDVVTNLPPYPLSNGTYITQTVTTGYTTQVKKVQAQATDDTGQILTLNLDVI